MSEKVQRRRLLWREATARYRRALRARAIALLGGKCQAFECEATEGLEFAHVQKTGLNGRGRGSTKRHQDVLKNPDCYQLLCRRHHMELDYAGIDPWNPEPDPNQRELLEEVPF